MKNILLFSLAMQIYLLTQAQIKDSISYEKVEKDSIYFAVTRIKSSNDTTLYRINVFNYSKLPCCVLHSSAIFPGQFSLPTLVKLSEDSSENYNLHYSTKEDAVDDLPLGNWSTGYVILPYQNMEFEVFIPNSNKRQRLKAQYFKLPNYCYNEFSAELLSSKEVWHRKYLKQTVILEIPHK
jgi:hypothetical protein